METPCPQTSGRTRRRRFKNSIPIITTDSSNEGIVTTNLEPLRQQIIDDDSLIRIFSFIPPIPFFFTTLPLINKQFFQYFFNFVTTCPKEELNYFKEMNFWDFFISGSEPKTKEQFQIFKNHFRLLFGEKDNIYFNILQRKIHETTEILWIPCWAHICSRFFKPPVLDSFENLKFCVFPPSKQENCTLRENDYPKLSNQILDPKRQQINQTLIFMDYKPGFLDKFLFKLSRFRSQSKETGSQKNIERVISWNSDSRSTAINETHPNFENAKFFFQASPLELSRNENTIKMIGNDKDYEDFSQFVGFKRRKLGFFENPIEISQFDFGKRTKTNAKFMALLNNLQIDKTKPSTFLLHVTKPSTVLNSLVFLIGKGFELRNIMDGDGWVRFFKLDTFRTSLPKLLEKIGVHLKETEKNDGKTNEIENFALNNENFQFMTKKTKVNIAENIEYPKNLIYMIKFSNWDFLGVNSLQNFFENGFSCDLGDKSWKIAEEYVEYHQRLWKFSFDNWNLGDFFIDAYGETKIFKLWNKLEPNLILSLCKNRKMHRLLRYAIHFGENENTKDVGMLNTPEPSTDLMPLDYLIDTNPHFALRILKKHQIPIYEKRYDDFISYFPEKTAYPHQKMKCFWNLKPISKIQISNPSKIVDEMYYYSRFLQSDKFEYAQKYYNFLVQSKCPNLKPIEEIENQFTLPDFVTELAKLKTSLRQLATKLKTNLGKLGTSMQFFKKNIENVKISKTKRKNQEFPSFTIPMIDRSISLERFLDEYGTEIENQMNSASELYRNLYKDCTKASQIFKKGMLFGEKVNAEENDTESNMKLMEKIILHEYFDNNNNFFDDLHQKMNFVPKFNPESQIMISELREQDFKKTTRNIPFYQFLISQFLQIQDISGKPFNEIKKESEKKTHSFDIGALCKAVANAHFSLQSELISCAHDKMKHDVEINSNSFLQSSKKMVTWHVEETKIIRGNLDAIGRSFNERMTDPDIGVEIFLRIDAAAELSLKMFDTNGNVGELECPKYYSFMNTVKFGNIYVMNRKEIEMLLVNCRNKRIDNMKFFRNSFQKYSIIVEKLNYLCSQENKDKTEEENAELDVLMKALRRLKTLQFKFYTFMNEFLFYGAQMDCDNNDKMMQIMSPFFTTNNKNCPGINEKIEEEAQNSENLEENTQNAENIEENLGENAQNSENLEKNAPNPENLEENLQKHYSTNKNFYLNSLIPEDSEFNSREQQDQSKMNSLISLFVKESLEHDPKKAENEEKKKEVPSLSIFTCNFPICKRLDNVDDFLSTLEDPYTNYYLNFDSKAKFFILPSFQFETNDEKERIRINNIFFKLLLHPKFMLAQKILKENPKFKFNSKEIQFLQAYASFLEEKTTKDKKSKGKKKKKGTKNKKLILLRQILDEIQPLSDETDELEDVDAKIDEDDDEMDGEDDDKKKGVDDDEDDPTSSSEDEKEEEEEEIDEIDESDEEEKTSKKSKKRKRESEEEETETKPKRRRRT